jgi:PAS domain S-box-containing protein
MMEKPLDSADPPFSDGDGATPPQEPSLRTIMEMLDSAPSSITVHDADGRFLYANRKTFEMHGFDKAEFMSLNLRQLDTPSSVELMTQRVRLVQEQGHATFEVEHFRKDRSILPMEVTAKQVTWEGRPALLSIALDLSEQRTLQERSMRYTRDLALLHLFVVGLGTQTDDAGMHRFIAQSLKEFAGAYFVSISDYDPKTLTLAHRHLAIDPGIAGRFIQMLGARVEDIRTPLSEENYELVTRKGWSLETSLHEASFGSIPLPVAATLQTVLQLDRFIGISFLSDDRLYGTSLLALRRDQPNPSMEMLQAFRHVAAIALGRRVAEQEQRQLLEELRQARLPSRKGRVTESAAQDLMRLLTRIMERTESALARVGDDAPIRTELGEILASAKSADRMLRELEDRDS